MKGICQVIGCSLLGAAMLSGLGVLLAHQMVPRPAEPASHPPAPFTDLESAIARKGFSPDWKVHRRPDLPGPYRLVGLTFSIGTNPDESVVVSHPDATGRPVAPIELRGHPDFAQMAIHLEPPDGRITGAVLKR